MGNPAEIAQALLTKTGKWPTPIDVPGVIEASGLDYDGQWKCGIHAGFFNIAGLKVICVNQHLSPEHKRFAAARAFGYQQNPNCELKSGWTLCDVDNLQCPLVSVHDNPDIWATRFAFELVTPVLLLQQFIERPSWPVVFEIANLFRIDPIIAAIRLMGLTSDICAFVVSRRHVIVDFHPSHEFAQRHSRPLWQRTLHPDTCAYHACDGLRPPADVFEVPPGIWCDGPYGPKETILEMTLPPDRDGRVLTLLCDRDGLATREKKRWINSRRDLRAPLYVIRGGDHGRG